MPFRQVGTIARGCEVDQVRTFFFLFVIVMTYVYHALASAPFTLRKIVTVVHVIL